MDIDKHEDLKLAFKMAIKISKGKKPIKMMKELKRNRKEYEELRNKLDSALSKYFKGRPTISEVVKTLETLLKQPTIIGTKNDEKEEIKEYYFVGRHRFKIEFEDF